MSFVNLLRNYIFVICLLQVFPYLDMMKLLFFPFTLLFAIASEDDRVLHLPGFSESLPSRHYSGYLKGSATVNLFYYFVEVEDYNPKTSPTLLWLNGGPGCSSLDGLWYEHGPFKINKDGTHLSKRSNSWNKISNVLYIESPVGKSK